MSCGLRRNGEGGEPPGFRRLCKVRNLHMPVLKSVFGAPICFVVLLFGPAALHGAGVGEDMKV